jgi:predicted amidohydrolase
MPSLTIALAQLIGSTLPSENLAKARRMADAAAEAGAHMLVLPEMFMALPSQNVPLSEVAESLDDAFGQGLTALARERGIFVAAGLWEKVPGHDKVYNVLAVFDPNGELAAVYRKLHLFDALSVRESERMLAGQALPPVVSVCGMKVGLAICYDVRFPELFRYLARQGAEVLLVPAAWYAGPLKEDHWLTLLRARAIENTCYAAGAVLTGKSFIGRSAAFDPFGVPLADGGEAEGLVVFEANSNRVSEVRARLPTLEHCRPHVFAET